MDKSDRSLFDSHLNSTKTDFFDLINSSKSLKASQIIDTLNGSLSLFDDVDKFWHSHVYAKPSQNPTPHLISNILGLGLENESKNQLNLSQKVFQLSPSMSVTEQQFSKVSLNFLSFVFL